MRDLQLLSRVKMIAGLALAGTWSVSKLTWLRGLAANDSWDWLSARYQNWQRNQLSELVRSEFSLQTYKSALMERATHHPVGMYGIEL